MILSSLLLSSEKIDKKWASNKNCEACHTKISTLWETSRHSNSHFSKNDLYKKSLEYIVEKSPKLILDEVKVECAKCHNPRITKKYMSSNDKILLALGVTAEEQKYKQILSAEHMKNSINCIVCHNADKIHLDKDIGSQGFNSIKFGTQGTMFGPFDDADSPYHKTEFREHFADSNPKLCFACHFSGTNRHGVEVYATGKEYDSSKDLAQEEGCKKCHMSEKKQGVASNFSIHGKQPRVREVRDHRFASIDNSDIFTKQVAISSDTLDDTFTLTLANKAPHAIPTGYGLREIIITVQFFDKHNRLLDKQTEVIGASWRDKRGKITIPHLAKSLVEDTRIQAKSTKNYFFLLPQKTKIVDYKISYRLINSDMAKKIGVTDQFFLKKYLLKEERIRL